jgi:hypothetical protein
LAGAEQTGALYAYGGTSHTVKISDIVLAGWRSISAQISISKVFIPNTGGNATACISEYCWLHGPSQIACNFDSPNVAITAIDRMNNITSITFRVDADAGCFAWATYMVFYYQ